MRRFSLIKIAVTVALALVIVAVACSAASVVTVRFATYGLLEKATADLFKKMAVDFEAANKGVKIEFVNFPYGDLKQQVLVMASAGDYVDVVHGERPWLSTFVASGYFAELDRLMSRSYLKDFYPNILDDMRSNGKLYAIPWIVTPYVLYYNKDLFTKAGLDPNAPPKTYDQAVAYAAKIAALKDKDGNQVYGLGETTASVPVSGSSILRVLYSFGGGIWDKKGNVSVNTPGNVEAFKYLKTLYENKYNAEVAKLKDLRNLFAIGRLGMYFDQLWGISGAIAINPEIQGKLGLAPPPATAATKGLSTLEAHMLLIMKDSKHKSEAARFVEYITSKDVMVNYYTNYSRFIAPRASIDKLPEMNDAFIKPAKTSISQCKAMAKQHPNMESAFLELCAAAQKVTVGKSSPETVVKELDAKLKEILK